MLEYNSFSSLVFCLSASGNACHHHLFLTRASAPANRKAFLTAAIPEAAAPEAAAAAVDEAAAASPPSLLHRPTAQLGEACSATRTEPREVPMLLMARQA